MIIVRPVTDDGMVGYDEFGQFVWSRPDRQWIVSSFIWDVREHTCAICARGWEPTGPSMGDQAPWHMLGEGLAAYVHETCLERHTGLVERAEFYRAIVAARLRFRGLAPIANGYAPDARPWYRAELTDHPVRLVLGCRKRVDHVEAIAEGGTKLAWWREAEAAFAAEDVTKAFSERSVLLHAWTAEKTREYIATLAKVGGLSVPSGPA